MRRLRNPSRLNTTAPVVEARGLVKKFGFRTAVGPLDLRLAPGEFTVIFGPNGAGKTTLLRLLAGIARPTRGEVWIAGEQVGEGGGEWRRRLGVLSHQSYLYPGLTATENLAFYARLYELDQHRERVRQALAGVGLAERAGDRVRDFSRGMQQRLALARTLLHDPSVVFLDEPYSGLDPHAAALLRGVLERLRDAGRTVLLVTHNLSQGLELADRVVVQARGRWLFDEPRTAVNARGWEAEYTARVAAA